MSAVLDQVSAEELLELLPHMSDEDRRELDALLTVGAPLWMPQVGPQTMAAESRADILFYGGSAGGGKGLALNTPIATPDGWTTMGELQVGDLVFDDLGRPCTVVGATDPVLRRCFRLRFDDGTELIADDVHRWVTFDAKDLSRLTKRDPQWMEARRASRPPRATSTTKSAAFKAAVAASNAKRAGPRLPAPTGAMRETWELAATIKTKTGRANHAIPLAAAIQLPDADLPIPPYTLGAWLGDGTSASAVLTGIDPEVWGAIEAEGFEVRHYEWDTKAHNVLGLQTKLRRAGLLNNKHIPAPYLRASVAQRLELLRGLMDTDGHAALDGGCEFDACRESLADGVLELALSLGLKATKLRGTAKLNGDEVGPKWRVRFTGTLQVFKLRRKAERIKPTARRTTRMRYLVTCEEVESVPTRCIAVESESRQYLAGRALVPTHNTDLLCGLAVCHHEKSIIFRREAVQLVGIEERLTEILGSRTGYNSQDAIWRLPDMPGLASGRTLELGSVKDPGDWVKYQGRPHDLICFDEIPHFLEMQVRQLMGWKRSGKVGVRQRVVMAGNPPTDSEGEWVTRFFAPWLDPDHPNPAKPGELRWFVSDEDGRDLEVPSDKLVKVGRKWVKPHSRTFIPSVVRDNLFLRMTGYESTLDALPEPFRSQMRDGSFTAGRRDGVNQVIPTAWIKAAQARWLPRPHDKGVMTAMGFDPSRGGDDRSALARRHGNWFDEVISVPGAATADGPSAAAYAIQHVRDGAPIPIDAIGIGSSALDFCRQANLNVWPIVASDGTTATDKSGQLRMRNLRALMYWRLREALDPTNDEAIALPPDEELRADLAAVKFKLVTMGKISAVLCLPKDDIRKELGRSPDKGDAVAMTFLDGLPPPDAQDRARAFRARPRVSDWRAA